jgi:hypothetical protein
MNEYKEMEQGCQMVSFKLKIPIWVNFRVSCNERCFVGNWSILMPFRIFVAIWYILWSF